jgi:hypothetical protein
VSGVLDTHESRDVFRRHVEHRTPIFGHAPPYGEVYTCPRCGWKSKGMKWVLGAEWQGEQHALVCKPRTSREAVSTHSERTA